LRGSNNVIISCAVTGSIHTPSMSAALPISPPEIAREAIGAAEAGATILHLHARHPESGYPSPDPEVFLEFLPEIRKHTDAVINITTGGSAVMSVDERMAAAKNLQPEVASLNMGSMNFNFAAAANRVSNWKFDWEQEYVLGSAGRIFSNTFVQIERILTELGSNGTRFEFECYDIGHLYSLAHFVERGLVEPPFFIQGVFGVLGGIGPDHSNLHHMIAIADMLFGEDYYFSAFGAGRHQMGIITASALAGGFVRVGLEDSLYIGRGQLATCNAQQVEKAVRIITEMGREVATPEEARKMLALKGGDAVKF
jgi:3,5-dioxohexanoate:acetyl-CoA acetone transferase